jgi:hypothetical protein
MVLPFDDDVLRVGTGTAVGPARVATHKAVLVLDVELDLDQVLLLLWPDSSRSNEQGILRR